MYLYTPFQIELGQNEVCLQTQAAEYFEKYLCIMISYYCLNKRKCDRGSRDIVKTLLQVPVLKYIINKNS